MLQVKGRVAKGMIGIIRWFIINFFTFDFRNMLCINYLFFPLWEKGWINLRLQGFCVFREVYTINLPLITLREITTGIYCLLTVGQQKTKILHLQCFSDPGLVYLVSNILWNSVLFIVFFWLLNLRITLLYEGNRLVAMVALSFYFWLAVYSYSEFSFLTVSLSRSPQRD